MNSIDDINKHCLVEFRKHWECLDNNNQQLWQCRPAERKLNKCVFENLVCQPPIQPWLLVISSDAGNNATPFEAFREWWLIPCAEAREGDSRYAEGRGAGPSPHETDILAELSGACGVKRVICLWKMAGACI
jgi:hypothetical protein